MGRQMYGKAGEDLTITVPVGTVVINVDTDEVIGDLTAHGDRLLVAKGGKGGLGNMHFKSSINRSPRKATPGCQGEERTLKLELKLLADVGLLGFPNAGKSTFIRAVSAATPKVADYPFTTLYPNLGVVSVEPHRSFVIADIPGLIEGAAEGAGLGSAVPAPRAAHAPAAAPGGHGADGRRRGRPQPGRAGARDRARAAQVRSGDAGKAALAGAEQGRPDARGRAAGARAEAVIDELGWKEPLVPGLGDRPRGHLADHARRAWRSSTDQREAAHEAAEDAAERAQAAALRRCRLSAIAQATKNPAQAGFFAAAAQRALRRAQAALQRLDAGGQAALVAGGLVLVDQATRAEAIEDRLGDDEGGLGAGGVVGVERLEHLLDGGAQHRTLAALRALRTTVCLARFLADLILATAGILETGEMKGGIDGRLWAIRRGKYGRFSGLRQPWRSAGVAPRDGRPEPASPEPGMLRSTAVFSAMTLLSRIAGCPRHAAGQPVRRRRRRSAPSWWPTASRTSCAGSSPRARSHGLRAGASRDQGEAATRRRCRTSSTTSPARCGGGAGGDGLGMLLAPWIARLFLLFARRRAGEVRADRGDAADHVPVPDLHLADGAGRRGAQQLPPLRPAGADAGAAQPRRDRRRCCGWRRYFDVPIKALAWGVLVAGVAAVAGAVAGAGAARACGRAASSTCATEGVRRVFKLMLPTMFSSSVAQVNLLVGTVFASLLVPAAQTWLYYSDRLIELPLGLFGVAIGTVILPHAVAPPRRHRCRGLFEGARLGPAHGAAGRRAGGAGPGAAGRAADRDAVPATASSPPTTRTWRRYALTAMSIGMPAFMLSKVLLPAFYARQDTRTPMRAAVTTVVVNVRADRRASSRRCGCTKVAGAHAGIAAGDRAGGRAQRVRCCGATCASRACISPSRVGARWLVRLARRPAWRWPSRCWRCAAGSATGPCCATGARVAVAAGGGRRRRGGLRRRAAGARPAAAAPAHEHAAY